MLKLSTTDLLVLASMKNAANAISSVNCRIQ